MIRFACIVEGQGEEQAVPNLIQRIAGTLDPPVQVIVSTTIRVPRSKVVKPGELERHVELAARKVAPQGVIFILVDSDDDCPAILGPDLYRRATAVRGNLPIAVVLAHREYEAWFLATADTLGGCQGFPDNIGPHPSPETICGAKEWIRGQMGRPYLETQDQLAFTRRFDLGLARTRADSFDKCYREICRLLSS